jgi:hypothetical protein
MKKKLDKRSTKRSKRPTVELPAESSEKYPALMDLRRRQALLKSGGDPRSLLNLPPIVNEYLKKTSD